MLDFLFWGIVLNMYSSIVLWIILKAIYPKGYVSKHDKKFPLSLKITITLIPYFLVILDVVTLFGLLYFGFDYKKIEAYRDKINKGKSNE